MVDEPNSEYTEQNPKTELVAPTQGTENSTQTSQPAASTREESQRPNYVMRTLEAVKRKTKATTAIIDKHGPVMTTLATVAIAILTGFYVHYSRAQWQVMSGQLTQMQKANDANGKQFSQTLCQMQAQTEAQGRAATASQQTARTAAQSLSLSGKQFAASERPYLTVDSIGLNGSVTNGQNFALSIAIKNTGRSAALKVRVCKQIQYTTRRLEDPLFPQSVTEDGYPIDIGAGEEKKAFVVTDTVPPERVLSAINITGKVYLVGAIRYTDELTKHTYSLPLCGFYATELPGQFALCDLPADLKRETDAKCQDEEIGK